MVPIIGGAAGSTPGQSHASCTNGHRLSPYEQNTQQSPGFGDSVVPQAAHSYKTTHRSSGIVSVAAWLHVGHVTVTLRSAIVLASHTGVRGKLPDVEHA